MKGKLKRTIIKVYKGIKKLIKIIRELGIEKVVKISIFSLIIITVVILLIKICFKTEVANINDIKINIDKEPRENYPKTPTLWGDIEIPSLKIKVNMYKGSDKLLKYGVVHHPETYFPTDGKLILLSGSSKYLKNLTKLKENDTITLNTIYGTYDYKVIKTRIRTIQRLKEEINNINTETLILYTDINESERVVIYAR